MVQSLDLKATEELVMSTFDGLFKGMFGGAEAIELEFTRMLLDVRGYTNDEVEAFFRKIGKRPVAIGEPIEVSHSRRFTRVPGLARVNVYSDIYVIAGASFCDHTPGV